MHGELGSAIMANTACGYKIMQLECRLVLGVPSPPPFGTHFVGKVFLQTQAALELGLGQSPWTAWSLR